MTTGEHVVTVANRPWAVLPPTIERTQTRSAPVAGIDHGAGATAHREVVVAGVSEAHCAFCGVSIEPTRGRRYCSGRCRARASDARRIGEAMCRERLRQVYDRLDDSDQRGFDAERAAGDSLACEIASLLSLGAVGSGSSSPQIRPTFKSTFTRAAEARAR